MNADLSEAFGSELVLLGAADDAALADAADALVRFLDQAPGVPLRDVAYTCARRFPESRTAVLAIVARSAGELRARLDGRRVLVVGGAGTIGSNYVKAVLRENETRFDCLFDLNAVVADPAKPQHSRLDYLGKDKLHFNIIGGAAVADAIDLGFFSAVIDTMR